MNFLLHIELQSAQGLIAVSQPQEQQANATLASRTAKHTQEGNKQYYPRSKI